MLSFRLCGIFLNHLAKETHPLESLIHLIIQVNCFLRSILHRNYWVLATGIGLISNVALFAVTEFVRLH
jgi:hypothetical protein